MSLFLLGILNAQAAGGAAGAYDLLETQVLSSSASSVTFTGLGSYSDYKHLQIRATYKEDATGFYSGLLRVQFNSDSGSNYASHRLNGTGSTVSSGALTSQTSIDALRSPTTDVTAGAFGGGVIDILDFSSASKNTTLRSLSGFAAEGVSIGLLSGLYISTSAITSISLIPAFGTNIVTGSRFSLYGVK